MLYNVKTPSTCFQDTSGTDLEPSWQRLWTVLEWLGIIGGCLGRVWYASWGVSSAPRATWHHARLDWVQGRRSAWPQRTNKYQREERLTAERLPTERLQTSVDHLPLNPDTQLGAFGPGADPKRRRAASPPPRLLRKENSKSRNICKIRPKSK